MSPFPPLVVEVRWRWWLRTYLASVALVAALTGLEPDEEKLTWWIRRGLVIRFPLARAVLAA